MTEQIEDLLHRRTDLSTFLVHFTRESDDGKTTSQDNLLSILKKCKLKARNTYGMAGRLAKRFLPQLRSRVRIRRRLPACATTYRSSVRYARGH